MSVEVADDPELSRYEVRVDGQLAGFAQYRLQGERITIYHAEVDEDYEGQGVGSQLARDALDDVRARGLDLIPRCPFIANYVRRYCAEYLDLVPEALRERVMSS